jgi:hypothetical protein
MNAPFRACDYTLPIPPFARRGGRPVKYDFAGMDVGRHFDVPRCGQKTNGGSCRTQNRVNSCALQWAKKHNPTARFTVRIIDDHTVRCWRIA